jgi:hypothetical protein
VASASAPAEASGPEELELDEVCEWTPREALTVTGGGDGGGGGGAGGGAIWGAGGT